MLPNLEDRIQAVETALPPDDDCHTQAHNHRAMAAVPVSLVASGSSGNVRFNSHSRYIIGDLRCNAGCSIYRIVRALGLRLDDLAARPQTMTPDFESMDASERRAYDAADRVRRSRHKVASEHFRRCRREVARVKREIEAVTARRSSRDGGTTGSEPHDDRTAGNEPCKDCADGISSGDAARDDAANDHPPCDGAHGSKTGEDATGDHSSGDHTSGDTSSQGDSAASGEPSCGAHGSGAANGKAVRADSAYRIEPFGACRTRSTSFEAQVSSGSSSKACACAETGESSSI